MVSKVSGVTKSARISTRSKKSCIDQLEVEDHVGDKTSYLYLVPLPYALVIGGNSGRHPLKREESVCAEHYLIFVAVVEDRLARVVIADLRPEQ